MDTDILLLLRRLTLLLVQVFVESVSESAARNDRSRRGCGQSSYTNECANAPLDWRRHNLD